MQTILKRLRDTPSVAVHTKTEKQNKRWLVLVVFAAQRCTAYLAYYLDSVCSERS